MLTRAAAFAPLIKLFCVLMVTPGVAASQVRGTAAHLGGQERNLMEVAAATPKFTTLVRYIRKAGLTDTLSHWGPFTLFAPTNAAFAALPRRTVAALMADSTRLRALLLRHILVGSAFQRHLVDLREAIMMSGDTMTITHRGAVIRLDDRAEVIAWTLRASNGVIHTIDKVILPRKSSALARGAGISTSKAPRSRAP